MKGLPGGIGIPHDWSKTVFRILPLFGIFGLAYLVWLMHAEKFLSINRMIESPDIIVIEAWASPTAYRTASRIYNENQAPFVMVCGVMKKVQLNEMNGNIARLQSCGVQPDSIVQLIESKKMFHRTLTSAKMFAGWLHATGRDSANVLVITMAAHARKTYLFYNTTSGKTCRVGIVSVPYKTGKRKGIVDSLRMAKYLTGQTVEWLYALVMIRLL